MDRIMKVETKIAEMRMNPRFLARATERSGNLLRYGRLQREQVRGGVEIECRVWPC